MEPVYLLVVTILATNGTNEHEWCASRKKVRRLRRLTQIKILKI